MGQLSRAPGAAQRFDDVACGARGRQAKARQLVSGVTVEIGDVGRIVGREALRAYLVGEAETPIVLHGACLSSIGRGKASARGPLLKDDHRDAPPPELDGERQATRTRPNDHDGAVALLGAHADDPVSRLRALMRAALKSVLTDQSFGHARSLVASYEKPQL